MRMCGRSHVSAAASAVPEQHGRRVSQLALRPVPPQAEDPVPKPSHPTSSTSRSPRTEEQIAISSRQRRSSPAPAPLMRGRQRCCCSGPSSSSPEDLSSKDSPACRKPPPGCPCSLPEPDAASASAGAYQVRLLCQRCINVSRRFIDVSPALAYQIDDKVAIHKQECRPTSECRLRPAPQHELPTSSPESLPLPASACSSEPAPSPSESLSLPPSISYSSVSRKKAALWLKMSCAQRVAKFASERRLLGSWWTTQQVHSAASRIDTGTVRAAVLAYLAVGSVSSHRQRHQRSACATPEGNVFRGRCLYSVS